jgi:hypothetical protein
MSGLRTSVTWLLALAVAALPLLGQAHVVHEEAEFAAALGAAEADCEAPHDHLEAPHHDHACQLCLQLGQLGWRPAAGGLDVSAAPGHSARFLRTEAPGLSARAPYSVRGPPSLL